MDGIAGTQTGLSAILEKLVTVFSQRLDDGFHHTFIKRRATTEVPSTLGAHSDVSVRLARRPVFDFAGRGQAKTLFRPFVGFHFV